MLVVTPFEAADSKISHHSQIRLHFWVLHSEVNFDLLCGESGPSSLWRKDMTWYGSHGFGVAENIRDYYKYFVYPINTAFTNKRIELDLIVCEGQICGAHGYLIGNFVRPLLG